MILAVDFSQYLAPHPPPPQKKKSLGTVTCTTLSSVIKYIMLYPHWLLLPIGISDYKYFRGAFNTLWQTVSSRGTNCLHRISKMTQAGNPRHQEDKQVKQPALSSQSRLGLIHRRAIKEETIAINHDLVYNQTCRQSQTLDADVRTVWY